MKVRAFILCCAFASLAANAQQYPTRPVRFVVPFAPGGSVDTLARTIAAPIQLPVGVITALVGVPVLLALLTRIRS